MRRYFFKILDGIEKHRNEAIFALFIISVCILLTGIGGIVYLEKRLDFWEDNMGTIWEYTKKLLTGEKPVIETSTIDIQTNQKLVPANWYYISQIKELRNRVAELEMKAGITKIVVTPTPENPFKIQ